MNNIIDLGAARQRKEAEEQSLEEQRRNEKEIELSVRLERIRRTIIRINDLMRELRETGNIPHQESETKE